MLGFQGTYIHELLANFHYFYEQNNQLEKMEFKEIGHAELAAASIPFIFRKEKCHGYVHQFHTSNRPCSLMIIAFPTRTLLIACSASLCFEGDVRESKSLCHAVMENLLLAAAIDRKQSDRVSFFNAARSSRKISFMGHTPPGHISISSIACFSWLSIMTLYMVFLRIENGCPSFVIQAHIMLLSTGKLIFVKTNNVLLLDYIKNNFYIGIYFLIL